jgi:AmiR/NasT family two-component response regulator
MSEALQTALHSRDLVNRACGVLLERRRFTPEQALSELMAMARSQHKTLRDISAELVAGTAAEPL